MKHRKIKKLSFQTNSVQSLIKRQQYALKLIELLKEGKTILNVDESWIADSDYVRNVWRPTYATGTVTIKALSMKVAVIAAISTEGHIYYSLTHSLTNSEVIGMFFYHLCKTLDLEDANWRENTVVLLDGASYHLS